MDGDRSPSRPSIVPDAQSAERRRRRGIIRSITALRTEQLRSESSSNDLSPRPVPSSATTDSPRAPAPSDIYLHGASTTPIDTRWVVRRAEALAELHDAGARLAETSSDLRSLLDQPVSPNLQSSSTSRPSEDVAQRGGTKRRKLNADAATSIAPRINYGYYGQVEPGQLKLEIASCDGGNYPDAEGLDRAYLAENVLQNDDSVYCTKVGRCNLLLRHQGDAPFCLKKIIINAPTSGFTAPIQQGMIFVSMKSQDLVERTAPYQMLYPPPKFPLPPTPRFDPSDIRHAGNRPQQDHTEGGTQARLTPGDRLSTTIDSSLSREDLSANDPWDVDPRSPLPTVSDRPRLPGRSELSILDQLIGSTSTPSPESSSHSSDADTDTETETELDSTMAIGPNPPARIQPFMVTHSQSSTTTATASNPRQTISSPSQSPSDDPSENLQSLAAQAQRLRRMRIIAEFEVRRARMLERAEINPSDSEIQMYMNDQDRLLRQHPQAAVLLKCMASRLHRPNEITWTKAEEPSPNETGPSTTSITRSATEFGKGQQILLPHAKFFIKKDMCSCEIEFEPAV